MPEQKEVEEMKEFMGVLMDVKVSMAELNGKVDKILSLEEKVNNTYDIAKGAERRSKDNDDDIKDLKRQKADKDDVERIIKDKDNWQRNLPAWIAVVISVVVFMSKFITF
ncbi:hypothetical protein [Halobacillus sp. BBL2006]|uniref:hypothetical protein n=1 Tax=Halobacillus sp. BBL2006 TaxID=1543706 RepID=UPI00054428A9|nr:hypothetical protein [Halobacillus sp. BBL2006]KHE73142.1 hypothetical protein LD39_00685 [Halobacillus sp. BBL2006]